MRKMLWMTMVLTMCGLAGSSMAQMPGGCEGPGGGKMLREGKGPGMGLHIGWLLQNKEKAQKAGLTEEQIASLESLFYKNREEMINLRAEQEKARLEVDKIMNAAQPDEAALLKAVDQLGLADTQLKKSHMLLQLKVRETIGQDKYNELARKQQMMFKQGMENRQGHKGKGKNQPPAPAAEPQPPINTPTEE